ncbi:AraC family transcriptional regulator of arabinose operon [Evansella vedderi]|uniref:AraC family transcriptional regulator of arabinose operon n=1 Tax=Evansella vedderi TaxID=38282 RepID=A0ABT9ZR79_9BACI|nr:AraC family transcriptional regulator [Evansella vedderi]MDQ0253241.1 AraC family transcriptional regulator of arabinose operon [Evansella vedderi]
MNIKFCGYSYHTQRFYNQYKAGIPGYLFRLQTEGTCKVILNEKELQIEKGDLLLMKPGDTYELFVDEGESSGDYHLLCEGNWIDVWWNRSSKPSISRIELNENIIAVWRFMIIEDRRPPSEKNEEILSYLLQTLCTSLERAAMETEFITNRPYAVTRMMRYIEENATSGVKVEEVAQYAGLSVSRSVHLFKSSVGKTIIEYAQEIRLAAAIDRLKYTTYTLEHIAEDCGFGTYSYFHRVFKKHLGVSPGNYRSGTT